MKNKTTFVAFFAGCLLTGLAAFGITTAQGHDDIENVPVANKASCSVNVGIGRLTSGNQCYNNMVMVGAWDGYLYCAPVTVSCP